MQRHYLPTKICLIKTMIFPVVMYECESWTIKKAEHKELMLLNCGVGEDSWESLGLQEIQPVNPKGYQSWIFIGRSDVETETPILWPLDAKNWLIWKDPDAGKDLRWEEKGMTEDEMVRWHHWTQWTWVWVNSGSWWCTGNLGMLQTMRSQRVRHDWAAELNWTGPWFLYFSLSLPPHHHKHGECCELRVWEGGTGAQQHPQTDSFQSSWSLKKENLFCFAIVTMITSFQHSIEEIETHADIENKLMVTKGEKEEDEDQGFGISRYKLVHIR